MIVIIRGPLAERICWLAHRMGCTPTEAVRQAIEDQEDLVADLESGGGPICPHEHNRESGGS